MSEKSEFFCPHWAPACAPVRDTPPDVLIFITVPPFKPLTVHAFVPSSHFYVTFAVSSPALQSRTASDFLLRRAFSSRDLPSPLPARQFASARSTHPPRSPCLPALRHVTCCLRSSPSLRLVGPHAHCSPSAIDPRGRPAVPAIARLRISTS